MKKTAQRNLSLITRCILAILIPCSALTLAQSGVTTPDRGVKLGNAYIVSEFDTINTTNGNLMLNFPLAQLPAGRGAATAGVSLSYSSKLYNMRSDKRPDYRRDPSYYDRTVIEPDVNGGWSLNVGAYKLEYETRFGQYEPNCTAAVGSELNQQIQYSIKLKVVFPDGSSHEMIPLLHKDVLGDRYFNVRMDGEIRTCQGTRHVARPVYYSRDGSFLRLVTQGPDRWTLYFADGSKVVDGNRFYDKNGNYVAGTTDEFGRSVTAGTVDMNGYQDVISKGFNGEEVVWRIKWKTIYVSKTYAACPPHHVCPDDQTFYNYPRDLLWASFDVVEKIIQPSQLGGGAYTFSYNGVDTPPSIPGPTTHGWGELSAIELPSGAKLKYEYGLDGQDGPEHVDQTRYILLNHVTSKTLTYDLEYDGQIVDDGAVERWDYDLFYDRSSVTAPDGSVTQTFFPTTEPDLNGNVPWDSGLTTKTISPDGTMVENIWERNSPTGCHGESTCPNGYLREHPDNPYVKATFTSIKEGTSYARTAIKAFTYDMNGNVIETREYDYMPFGIVPRENGLATGRPTGLPPNADNYLKRVNRTEFYNQPPPAPTNPSTNFYDPNIYVYAAGSKLLNLERAKEVRAAASGPVQSRVESVYDFVDRAAQNTKGGNLILARQWDSTRLPVLPPGTALDDSNSIKTQATYNEYGMPTTSTDANGNVTRTSYGLIAGPNTSYTDLYPTQTVTAFGTSVARTSTFTYDFFSGLVTLTTDADNGISVRTSYDAVGRPTLNAKAIGTSAESRTVTEYNDYERKIITRSDIETAGDGRKVSSQFFDPIGRIRLSKTLEDASVQSAANETDGIKIQTRYRSTAGNTYRLTSNPYRAPYSSQANGEETMGWTRSKTSSTGLREESETFSGAALPAPWGTSNTTTGVVVTVKDANSTTTTDQSGRKKRKLVDAFGQLIRVDEPDVSGNLGSVTAPVQPTTYSYNALGNMTRAQQGVQNRYFLYDSMGRLIRIRQPEQAVNPALGTIGNSENNSWTAAFSHDANGNVIGAVDPRNVSVSTAFDRLNRPITRSYSDATPTVTFVYDDSAVSYARGRLTKISSSVSELRYLGYDPDGRVTESEQVTDGRAYRSAYAYNLAGAITEQRYPSGRVVKNFREADGDISSVASRGPSGPFKNYAADLSYTSTGRIDRLQLGNGLWESARLNSRGQVVEMKLGNSSIEPAIWTVNYRYGELNQDGSVDILKNSGNVAKQRS
jgi:YD repeat-containing protein